MTRDLASSARTPTAQIALMERAHQSFAEARSIEDVLEIRDQAAALKAYAEKKRLGEDLVRNANELLLRAQRSLGEITAQIPKAPPKPGPGRGKKTKSPRGPGFAAGLPKGEALKAAGITKQEASRFEMIASIPDEVFEAEVQTPEASTAGLVRLAKEQQPVPRTPRARFDANAAVEKVDGFVRRVIAEWPESEHIGPLIALLSTLAQVAKTHASIPSAPRGRP